jgi:hypothetical protein
MDTSVNDWGKTIAPRLELVYMLCGNELESIDGNCWSSFNGPQSLKETLGKVICLGFGKE